MASLIVYLSGVVLTAFFLLKGFDLFRAWQYKRSEAKREAAHQALQAAYAKAMGDYYRSVEYAETRLPSFRSFRIEGNRITEDRPYQNEYFRGKSVEEICAELEGRA